MAQLRQRCIGCGAKAPPWIFTPHHRPAHYSRRIRPEEVEAFADGSIDLEAFEDAVGPVSESGVYVTENRSRLAVLVICSRCKRTWWTIQRGIVSGWFAHFGMRPPAQMADLYERREA